MNRPLWLDILYVGWFFVPPVVTAAAIAVVLAQWMGWSDLVMGLVYLASMPISIALWFVGLVLWARCTRKSAREAENESK